MNETSIAIVMVAVLLFLILFLAFLRIKCKTEAAATSTATTTSEPHHHHQQRLDESTPFLNHASAMRSSPPIRSPYYSASRFATSQREEEPLSADVQRARLAARQQLLAELLRTHPELMRDLLMAASSSAPPRVRGQGEMDGGGDGAVPSRLPSIATEPQQNVVVGVEAADRRRAVLGIPLATSSTFARRATTTTTTDDNVGVVAVDPRSPLGADGYTQPMMDGPS